MLAGKKIIIGVTGSIAAYKAAMLIRLLIKAGAEVKVVMTKSATQFITPLTLSVLSKSPVLTEIADQENWNNHVLLGRWADALIIAPASANTLAKMANGICDNILQAVYLSASCPVFIAPAMDEDMWHHAATRQNIAALQSREKHIFLPVENGELASGLFGEGRMTEPETIAAFLAAYFSPDLPLKGKKVLVTAGPTYEPIDPVRFIGNHSSGKMGFALAQALAEKGAEVSLVSGPTNLTVSSGNIKVYKVQTAADMFSRCQQLFPGAAITVMAAAVADYRPVKVSVQKIKKTEDHFSLDLEKTEDILKEMGKQKQKGQLLIGFALETNNEKNNALQKLGNKNLDMIVLNSLQDEGAGFGYDTNKITIIDAAGNEQCFPLEDKKSLARKIVSAIINLPHA